MVMIMTRTEIAEHYGLLELRRENKINDWELDFLLGLATYRRALSTKQDAIYERIKKKNEGHKGLIELEENWPALNNI